MFKTLQIGSVVVLCAGLAACTTVSHDSNGQPQWDFDHNVQYKQTKLADNRYHIVVIPDVETRFNRLATFLLRRSMDVCQSYGFKLEVLAGVEDFDTRKAQPNLIMSSLAANLECPASS